METNIQVTLTQNQCDHLGDLKDSIVLGCGYHYATNTLAVTTIDPMTQQKIDEVAISANALPDTRDYERYFDTRTLMGDMYQDLEPASILKLSPYVGAITQYCDWKNFTGIAEFLAGLEDEGIINNAESIIIKADFAKQGINLESYLS